MTNQPRLYFTSTEAVDGYENRYLSDILLYKDLQVKQKGDLLTIQCPISMFTYRLQTDEAENWLKEINKALLNQEFD